MKKTTKKLVSLGLAAAMAASLTACGGKSDNGATTAGAAETTAAADAGAADQTAGGSFKIGGIGPITGGTAIYGQAVMNGAELAINEINAAGGIGGAQIEYNFQDDESDTEKAVNAYNTLKDWGMQMLVGTVTSAPCIAVGAESSNDNLFQLTAKTGDGMCEEVLLEEMFAEILEEQTPQLDAKRLSASLSGLSGMKLAGNPTMLYRAMSNLVENAIKYNRENGSISISASRQEGNTIIKISDTGIGIPEEECERIFEPFYRVDQSRSRSVGGSGLGLALVKDIVEKHGGSIRVNSRAGLGSEFILYL